MRPRKFTSAEQGRAIYAIYSADVTPSTYHLLDRPMIKPSLDTDSICCQRRRKSSSPFPNSNSLKNLFCTIFFKCFIKKECKKQLKIQYLDYFVMSSIVVTRFD